MIKYLTFFLSFFLLFIACSSDEKQNVVDANTHYSRIISLAPAITETIFALNAGDRLQGVTRFCTFPPQTSTIPKVGGYFDPNYEAILRLTPDLVILMKEHREVKQFLEKNGIPFLSVDNHDVSSLLKSFETIGMVLGKEKQASALVASFQQKLSTLHEATRHEHKTLLVVDRSDLGTGSIGNIWAAGQGTFYDDFLSAVGAKNIVKAKGRDYQTLSIEGIMSLAPQVVIDITRGMKSVSQNLAQSDWYTISSIPAVRDSLVFYIDSAYTSVPGPRIIRFLDDLQEIFTRADSITEAGGKS